MFWDYFHIGWDHIINHNAWDHLLFIMALSAIYVFKDWKQVLILVTAFTIGHTVTLILATFNIIRFSSSWIEFLIPVTIMITALLNTLMKKFTPKSVRLNYFLALAFGLIHGMGFANGLRSLLGKESDILLPLLGFNLGLEAGQLVAVLGLLILAAIWQGVFKVSRRDWVLFLSGGAFMAALVMAMERLPFNL
ncbi:MAG: HupE/UreJ family protein [Bacteroidetes bacterium]|uniref:HupE/UreJ family protein n=1 Tax=Phnomibacter sp. TaxID=2836217 RepID=UPI002FDCEE6B|nr:HupE/UreJ family protein [Bacteroidota bacterium]